MDREMVPISLSPINAPVYLCTSGHSSSQEPELRNSQQQFQFFPAPSPPAFPTFLIPSYFIRPSLPPSLHQDPLHQTNSNFRLWQMFCRIASFIHSSSPDVEALSCFLVSSFTSWSNGLTFSKALKEALAVWKKLSNYQRMDYYHMAKTFMELEENELKLIMVDEEPEADHLARETNGPTSLHNETMNVEDLEDKAFNEYMEIMKDQELSMSQGSKELEDEVEDGNFLEYLNELCSQEEFVTNVSSIIDLDYLSSLPSSDPFSTFEQQEDQGKMQHGAAVSSKTSPVNKPTIITKQNEIEMGDQARGNGSLERSTKVPLLDLEEQLKLVLDETWKVPQARRSDRRKMDQDRKRKPTEIGNMMKKKPKRDIQERPKTEPKQPPKDKNINKRNTQIRKKTRTSLCKAQTEKQ